MRDNASMTINFSLHVKRNSELKFDLGIRTLND